LGALKSLGFDPRVVTPGLVDHFDNASFQHFFGGKIGLDPTAKVPREGCIRSWPKVIRMDPEVKARLDEIWRQLNL
jgi:4-hydroxy-3-polyprenylbenzoate decarboxylase